jgi:hypothetical protein
MNKLKDPNVAHVIWNQSNYNDKMTHPRKTRIAFYRVCTRTRRSSKYKTNFMWYATSKMSIIFSFSFSFKE